MQDSTYDAVFNGKLLDGIDPEQARQNFAKLFKLDDVRLDAIFSKLPRTIKKGLDKSQAQQLKAKMARAGYQVSFRKVSIEPSAQSMPNSPEWSLEPIKSLASDTSEPEQAGEAGEAASADNPIVMEQSKSDVPAEDGGQMWGSSQPKNRQKAKNATDDPVQKKTSEPSTVASKSTSRNISASASSIKESRFVDVEFLGNGKEYFRIWIVNILLSVVTFGIYSAWAKVRNNQYFYGNTLIEGSSFEYLANPIAILKGRLIAFAFLIIYYGAQHLFPLWGVFLPLLLLPLVPWIVVRSLAFNARNSAYRNIRFNFEGQWLGALKAFVLWPLAGVLTLTILMPYALNRQKQFIINHSSFGSSRFVFEGVASQWYGFFFKLMGVMVVAVILNMWLPSASMVITALLYIGVYSAYKTFEGNLVFNMTHLDSMRFHSNLQMVDMGWLYVSNTLAIFLTLGIFIPWAHVRMARYRAEHMQLEVVDDLDKFVADEQQKVTALGAEVGEAFDIEFSVI